MNTIFQDRTEAGQLLAAKLGKYAGRDDVIVLALPRGGVPVGFEIAKELRAPLDIFVVRKLGVPGREELAMGAIATGGVRVINREVWDYLGIAEEVLDKVTARELAELERREKAYRGTRRNPEIKDRIVILVDDGIATGSTMRAAVAAVRQQSPARLVVAVPTAAPSSCRQLEKLADEVITVIQPERFSAVGEWYDDFSQTGDDEVRALLDRAHQEAH